jgi:hypothetical protein
MRLLIFLLLGFVFIPPVIAAQSLFFDAATAQNLEKSYQDSLMPAPVAASAVKKVAPKPMKVQALIYMQGGEWTAWVNKEKLNPKQPRLGDGSTLESVRPDSITIVGSSGRLKAGVAQTVDTSLQKVWDTPNETRQYFLPQEEQNINDSLTSNIMPIIQDSTIKQGYNEQTPNALEQAVHSAFPQNIRR